LETPTTPLTCEHRPPKGFPGRVRVCTVGPFWTTGGTNWDQGRAQDQLMFDRPNRLANSATEDERT
jgi:hypothetical protein